MTTTDSATPTNKLSVEIWSDVVCPWCFIGKRRFEAALEIFETAHPDIEIDVAYRAFQLDPTAAPGVIEPVRQAYEKKFGGPEQASQIIDRVTAEAAAEGLDFNMDIALRSNTLAAHRLLALAEKQGCQHELKERLMQAYFSEGIAIGDVDELVRLGEEVGLDPETARSWLDSDGGKAEVLESLQYAGAAGITSVPTFVFNREHGIPGAQPAELFVKVLEELTLPGE